MGHSLWRDDGCVTVTCVGPLIVGRKKLYKWCVYIIRTSTPRGISVYLYIYYIQVPVCMPLTKKNPHTSKVSVWSMGNEWYIHTSWCIRYSSKMHFMRWDFMRFPSSKKEKQRKNTSFSRFHGNFQEIYDAKIFWDPLARLPDMPLWKISVIKELLLQTCQCGNMATSTVNGHEQVICISKCFCVYMYIFLHTRTFFETLKRKHNKCLSCKWTLNHLASPVFHSCSNYTETLWHFKLHPWKLTWHWKIPRFNRKYILHSWWIFHCHVRFPGVLKEDGYVDCRNSQDQASISLNMSWHAT